MKTSELELGKWYKTDSNEVLQVIRIKENRWGEMAAFMNDGRHYSYAYDFDMFHEVSAPSTPLEEIISPVEEEKQKDSKYWMLKLRHQELCDKKLALYRQGKNKNMRVAYINQELEGIRSELSKY